MGFTSPYFIASEAEPLKELFEHASAAFERQQTAQQRQMEQKVDRLEAKLTQKNEVLAELMEEQLTLNKKLGLLLKVKGSNNPFEIKSLILSTTGLRSPNFRSSIC